FVEAKDVEIARLSQIYVDRLRAANARVIEARARLVDAHTLEVGGERITAENILVATGGAPRLPGHGPGLTPHDAFHLKTLPRRLAILGAGYIGVEFAHIFAGFGVSVTVFHRGGILRGFDPDLVAEVVRGLDKHGIALAEGEDVTGFDLKMAAI